MRHRTELRKVLAAITLTLISLSANAEGIVNVKPYVGANVTYDDNVFRFSDASQAKAAFGSSKTSDVITTAEVGLDVDLRLSRQLVSLNTNISKNQYNHFNDLDNVGKALGLEWAWTMGSQVFGTLGISRNEAITSFNDLQNLSKNIRTADRHYFNANWQLTPRWIVSINASQTMSENSQDSLNNLNSDVLQLQTGLQYISPKGTVLGIAYRDTKTKFIDRLDTVTLAFLGDENTNKEFILNGAWAPTSKLRLSSRIRKSYLNYNNADFLSPFIFEVPTREFDTLSGQFTLDYYLTLKTRLSLDFFNEVAAIEDLTASYFRLEGFNFSPSWDATEKIKLSLVMSMSERDFLDESGIFLIDRLDKTKSLRASLLYFPTRKSLIRLSFITEERDSNVENFSYDLNTLSLLLRYDF